MVPIKLLIYEDNSQLRESVATLIMLSNDFTLAGSFGDVLNVVDQVKTINPDVILMDIDLPGMNGIEAVKKIRAFNTSIHIIMLTVFDDNKHVVDAICAGASGYLLKMHIPEKLLDSVKEVIQGHGGHVEVQSVEGEGTCFSLHVPRQPVQAPHSKVSESLSFSR